jgi:hypothetical protein
MNHPYLVASLRNTFGVAASSVSADRTAPLHPQGNVVPRMQGHLDAPECNGHPSEASFIQDKAGSVFPSRP